MATKRLPRASLGHTRLALAVANARLALDDGVLRDVATGGLWFVEDVLECLSILFISFNALIHI